MIIRRRMPRIINSHKRIGIIGMRSLQRSTMQIRRMLVSRLPERAPEDWQDAMAQPIGEFLPGLDAPDDYPMLTAGVEPYRRRSRGGRHQQPAAQRPTQSRGRVSDLSASSRMPPDLQAIFDQHKRLGHVQSNPDVKRQAELLKKTGGAVTSEADLQKPPPSSRQQRQSPPPQPAQREIVADDNFPVVVDIPPPRRVRSRVEYVNRPEPKSQPQSTDDDGDDESSLSASPIEQVNATSPDTTSSSDVARDTATAFETPFVKEPPAVQSQFDDEHPLEYDEYETDADWDGYDEGAVDDFATFVDNDEVPPATDMTDADQSAITAQRHVDDRQDETPSDISVQRDADHKFDHSDDQAFADTYPDEDPYEVYMATVVDRDADFEGEPSVPADISSDMSIQRTADEPVAVDNSTNGDVEDVRDDGAYDDYIEDEVADYRTEADVAPSDAPIARAVDPNIEAAIARAEQPVAPDIDTDHIDESSAPTKSPQQPKVGMIKPAQRMSVSSPEPPTRIQRQPLSGEDEWRESAVDTGDGLNFDAMRDDFVSDDAGYAESGPSLSMTRDEVGGYYQDDQAFDDLESNISYFESDEPASLPTQDVDLGTALFGPRAGDDRITGFDTPPGETEGPTPVMMPPIGRAHHPAQPFKMPSSQPGVMGAVQRTPDEPVLRQATTRPGQAPQRDYSEAYDSDEMDFTDVDDFVEMDQATVQEADLLSLLDMPADTPIQRSEPTTLGVQRRPEPTPEPSRSPAVQRSAQTGEVSAEVGEGTDQEDQEEDAQSSESAVKEMAEKVYGIIKRRLKIEQERYRNK